MRSEQHLTVLGSSTEDRPHQLSVGEAFLELRTSMQKSREWMARYLEVSGVMARSYEKDLATPSIPRLWQLTILANEHAPSISRAFLIPIGQQLNAPVSALEAAINSMAEAA